MPTYKVNIPGQGSFDVNSSTELTDVQAYKAAQQQVGKSGKIPEQEPLSRGESFMTGLGDPAVGLKQLYEHVAGSPEEAKKADTAVQQREKEFQRRGGSEMARAGGDIVSGIPAAAASGMIGGLPGAAIGGFVGGVVDPVAAENYVQSKIEQSLIGTAFGAGIGVGGKVLSSLAAPTMRSTAQEVMKSGVQLTPGQIAGGGTEASSLGKAVRRAEESFKSIPILGAFIKDAEKRGVESFNIATVNQALEPLGVKIDRNTPAGHLAIREGHEKLAKAYDDVLSNVSFHLDMDAASDIANLRQRASMLPEMQFKQYENLLQQRVAHAMGKGPVSGEELKAVESGLRNFANEYRISGDPAQRELAYLVDDTRGALRDGLIRQNPKQAKALADVDRAYAMFVRVEGAAARGATHYGVFTPNDLLQSIKQNDRTMRKGAFARGDALMQSYAELAHGFLAPQVADSGSPERLLTAGAAALGAGGLLNPKLAIPAAAVAPYTKPGQKAVNWMAGREAGPAAKATAEGTRRATPAVAAEASQELTPESPP